MDRIRTVAFMYDFDGTLCPGFMQEYYLVSKLNLSNEEFWKQCNIFGTKHNMDSVLAYMYCVLSYSKLKNIPISYKGIIEQGKKIVFFEGVEDWFNRMNDYGRTLGLNIEHYVISSGQKEIIEGSKIAKYFKRIFACSFAYDDDGNAFWPNQVVNYTTKTQYIFRIKKNALDNLYDQHAVNELVTDKSLLLPYSRMIYFGDGFTDIPCMKVIKDKGGNSICIYDPTTERSLKAARKIYDDERVNYCAPANYSEGSYLDAVVKGILNQIALDVELSNLKNTSDEDKD